MWACAPVLGLITYLAWWGIARDDALAPISAQSAWFREPSFPLWTLGRGLSLGLRAIGDTRWLPEAGDAALTILPLVVFLLGWRKLPAPSFVAYVALGFLIPLSLAIPLRPLLSMPRFVIVLFPIAWIAAQQLRGRAAYRGVLVASLAGWCALSVAFMNWRFVA